MLGVTTMSDQRKPRKEWEEAGIVGEQRFVALHYSEPADVLLVQFERMVASRYPEYPVYSIYMKRRLDARYAKIFGPDDVTSAVDVVTTSKKPLAFFNVMVASPGSILDRKSTGFNWSHVGQIDLATGFVTVAVDGQAFEQKHDGAWISKVLVAADDGSWLLCRVGGVPQHPSGVADERPVSYSLCRVMIATSDVQVVAPLHNVFF
jgi:hypothetical protein